MCYDVEQTDEHGTKTKHIPQTEFLKTNPEEVRIWNLNSKRKREDEENEEKNGKEQKIQDLEKKNSNINMILESKNSILKEKDKIIEELKKETDSLQCQLQLWKDHSLNLQRNLETSQFESNNWHRQALSSLDRELTNEQRLKNIKDVFNPPLIQNLKLFGENLSSLITEFEKPPMVIRQLFDDSSVTDSTLTDFINSDLNNAFGTPEENIGNDLENPQMQVNTFDIKQC